MNRFHAASRCECQATLTAILDEKHHVLEGSASHGATTETAPAHSMHVEGEHFDLGWLCPFCGRNTLRTFYAGALRAAPPVPPADAPPPRDA